MATRRDLRSVAWSIASQFGSRNNDLDGWWAVGRLSGETPAGSLVDLDLRRRTGTPDGAIARTLANRFGAKLVVLLLDRRLPRAWVREAGLAVEFADADSGRESGCLISVTLTDDHGDTWTAHAQSSVRRHDPRRERRSAPAGRNRSLSPTKADAAARYATAEPVDESVLREELEAVLERRVQVVSTGIGAVVRPAPMVDLKIAGAPRSISIVFSRDAIINDSLFTLEAAYERRDFHQVSAALRETAVQGYHVRRRLIGIESRLGAPARGLRVLESTTPWPEPTSSARGSQD